MPLVTPGGSGAGFGGERIDIGIYADDKFSQKVSEIEQRIDQLKQHTEAYNKEAANVAQQQQKWENIGSTIGTVTGVVGGLTTAIYAAKKALDVGAEGAGLSRLEDSFDSLTMSANVSGDALLNALDNAARGAVSNTDLILSTNRAMMLGLGSDAEQLSQLMEVAAFRGRAMGLSTTQAFNDIVTGVGRASPMILDNLGIVVDADSTYKAYAESVGKSTDALTKQEKTQALLTRVLEEGNRQIEEAGGLANDTASSYERMNAQATNLFDTLKKGAGEAFQPAAEVLTAWFVALQDFPDAGESWADWAAHAINLSKGIVEVEEEIIDTRRESIESLRDHRTAIEDDAEALKDQSKALSDVLSSMSDINRERERFEEKSANLKDQEQEIKDAITKENLAYGELLRTGDQTQGQIDAHIVKNDELIKKLEENRQAQEKLTQDTIDASKERIYQTVEEGLAKDGINQQEFEFLQRYQVQQGLISQADADRAIAERAAAEQVIADYEAQNAILDTTQQKLDALVNGSPYNVQINIETVGSIPTIGGSTRIGAKNAFTGGLHEQRGTGPLQGGRAEGGPVAGGEMYLVGERGPELFVPRQSGEIIPNHRMGSNIIVNINGGIIDRRTINVLTQEIIKIQTGG